MALLITCPPVFGAKTTWNEVVEKIFMRGGRRVKNHGEREDASPTIEVSKKYLPLAKRRATSSDQFDTLV